MIKPFSKKQLKIINFLFIISFSKAFIRNSTKLYLKEIGRGNRNFASTIERIGYTSNTTDYKRLTELYSLAVNFRSNKKLVKTFLSKLFITPIILFILSQPFVIPYFCFVYRFGGWHYVLIFFLTFSLGSIVGLIMENTLEYVKNFNVKIGKTLTRMIQATLIGTFCSLIYFVFPIEEGVFKAALLAIYSVTFILISFSIFEFIISEAMVDAFYYSKKIQITDALIIESAYRLSDVNWSNAIKKKGTRQNSLDEIERLSGLIEKDWSSHILAGDEQTNRWKVSTLRSIANRFRRFKRGVILPSADTPIELESQFKSIFEKILKHDLQALIDAEVTAERLKKKSKFAAIQSVLVAVLPIVTALIIKNNFPGIMEENILHIGIAISGLWLLICILLWLDPNLADKLATIKSFKDVVKRDNSE